MSDDSLVNKKVNLGMLVEITLKHNAVFNAETTTIPTYHAPEKDGDNKSPSTKKISGYIAQITEEYICIVPGWDVGKKESINSNIIGAINIDWDAMFANVYKR